MRITVIIILSFFFICCTSKNEEAQKLPITPNTRLITTQKKFTAGDSISLSFKTNIPNNNYKLLIKNAFGNTLLSTAKNNNTKITFKLPKNYTKLAGPCTWKLLFNNKNILNGKLNISSNTQKATHTESYFGPRSVTAGYNDFSMLTVSPTDVYDNPLDDNTAVTVKYQFLENISEVNVKTKNFIAWYNVQSTTKSGRILVTSACNGTTSKELTTIVYPANATNFKIKATSAHHFADGNQILTLKSNIIKDKFGNQVSNGTLVTFVIKNNNAYLYTVGTTLNGIAEAKTLHPDKASTWEIQAFITGAAESNTITYNFKSAIKDYPVHFSKGNRNIDIGPFESFMTQLVPDGVLLQLDIYNNNGKFIETKKTTTKNGSCNIYLGAHFLPEGRYKLKIKAAGITKEFTKNIHDN